MNDSFSRSRGFMYAAWGQSLLAMAGSLFLSEVMDLPPCILCWYQRIFMYPIFFILTVGIFRKDQNAVWYAFPLAAIGWAISVYHNLLYWGVIPESLAPCRAGISCTTRFFEWFGFVTVPFLSFAAFSAILAFLIAAARRAGKEV